MSADLRIGTQIGDYRIESLLGRGGMSVVYLTEHVRLKRKAALKVLSPELAEDPTFRQRFADPNVEVEVGTRSIPVMAIVITGEERDALYARQVERRSSFADYEKKTKRKIPVIALEPVS